MLAHARFAKSFRAHLGQNTATATTQARILPERFHGPDEPPCMQRRHRPESMPSEANTISILRPKKEERRAKQSLLILFRPRVFIPRRDV